MEQQVRLSVNGIERESAGAADRSLLGFLRDDLGLTGAKTGCGEGACGVCTVLVDGAAVQACVTSMHDVVGRLVTTVEGLAGAGTLHPVQQALLDLNVAQCGYCIPGMVLGAAALLAQEPEPDEHRIRAALNGHVCRCGAYPRILRAVQRASPLLRHPIAALGSGSGAGAGGPGRRSVGQACPDRAQVLRRTV